VRTTFEASAASTPLIRVKALSAVLVAGVAVSALAQSSPPAAKNWGPTRHGVRVSLSLDKLKFEVGEEIPLHIAAQVVSAKRPVYAVPDKFSGAFMIKWDFSRAFHLTILDENGHVIGNNSPSNVAFVAGGSSGPLVCTPPVDIGHIYTVNLSASWKQKTVPTLPGRYRLIVTWSLYKASGPPCDPSKDAPGSDEQRPFVTASSLPITIQVLGNP
jgi:hypothetical protein